MDRWSGRRSHQFYVRQLLGDGERVAADGQHVPLDAGLRLGLDGSQTFGRRGVDFDQRLLVLALHRQPPDQALTHLANSLPVNLVDREEMESVLIHLNLLNVPG